MKFQLLYCDIAVGGDIRNVVHRGQDNPVTFPELPILAAMHGADAISNVYEAGFVERSETEEANRLKQVYGDQKFAGSYPGAFVRLASKGRFPKWEPKNLAPVEPINMTPARSEDEDEDTDGDTDTEDTVEPVEPPTEPEVEPATEPMVEETIAAAPAPVPGKRRPAPAPALAIAPAADPALTVALATTAMAVALTDSVSAEG